MNLLSLVALCLISSSPALAANSKRTPEAGLRVRDDPSQTVSLTQSSPTSTNSAGVAAYSTYSQKCGPDLNTATQAALETYENITSKADVSITDSDFISWGSGKSDAAAARTDAH
ncbi:hypothetical protein FB451DRAFT_1179044 [Mycena latifolia]|nr:hypothetical protein FB451DRAFT_1179044 [Mycena latifolia]